MKKTSVNPIRSEQDYQAGLERLETLMDAKTGSPEADEFDVLSVLVENFERSEYPIEAPAPLAAIRFRMEQEGLTARDLEPILGSRARVSEVLSGTRPLSTDMMKALHRHLHVPAESLLADDTIGPSALSLSKPTEHLLVKWGLLSIGESLGEMLDRALAGSRQFAMLRQTRSDRTNAKTDPGSMQAWCAGVLIRASDAEPRGAFEPRTLARHMRRLAQLSVHEDGPAKVVEELSDLGVALVILPSLPGTYLDGAAMLRADGVPIVALTLRRDQIDNFWFALMHELAHVSKHLHAYRPAILDDLEIGSSSSIEREADRLAEDALIPADAWAKFNSSECTSRAEVEELAARVGVHPAVVAARWRMLNRNYQRFSRMLGHRTIRRHFPHWQHIAA